MVDDQKKNRWEDRNDAIKIYKATGKYGWLHLVIGQNKTTRRKFIRLKRYMNWFSIPDSNYLEVVQKTLKMGAQELGWEYDESKKIIFQELSKVSADKEKTTFLPDDIVGFIEENPEFTKKLIALNIGNQNKEYFFELLEIIDEAVSKSGERFKTAFKEVVGKIAKQETRGMHELSDLMEKWNLFQITSLTNILKNRLDTIETFEKLIHDEKTFEINTDNSIHRILEKNMWLIDENYWLVQSNKSLRTFIGDEIVKTDKKFAKKRPDFACVNPNKDKLIIVEIKRPALELKKKELDQAELYHRIIKKYKGEKYNKIDVYLVGNKISDEAHEIAQLRKGVYIKTYSDFLENCQRRYQDYLKVIEK